jgi:carboxymethylenebutenolidase
VASSGRNLRIARINLGGVPRGAIILLCNRGALESAAVEGMNGLAEHGYESIAADVSPDGDPDVSPAWSDDADARALADVQVLIDQLAARGWSSEQIGVVGYGFGGRTALQAASEYVLGAAISVDASGVVAERPTRAVRTSWLGMFGELDSASPPAGVRALGRALRDQSPVFTQVVIYPGVTGDFYQNPRESIAHAAAFDSWQRVIEWLNARVVPRPTPLAIEWRNRQLVS